MVILLYTSGPGIAETRIISFYNVNTRENLRVTYKHNDQYDPAAMNKIDYIMRDWRRNEVIHINPKLIDLAYEVHILAGSRKPIHILSGYRSPITNAALARSSKGVAKKSRHIMGHAMDIYMPDISVDRIHEIALKLQRGGVGYYPHNNSPFIHLDIGNVRHWPRIPHDELARLFPYGRTKHVPADGRALQKRSPPVPIILTSLRHNKSYNVLAAAKIVHRISTAIPLPQLRNSLYNAKTPLTVNIHTVAKGQTFVPIPVLRIHKKNNSPVSVKYLLADNKHPTSQLKTQSYLFTEIKYHIPQIRKMTSRYRVFSTEFAKLSAPKQNKLNKLLMLTTSSIGTTNFRHVISTDTVQMQPSNVSKS